MLLLLGITTHQSSSHVTQDYLGILGDEVFTFLTCGEYLVTRDLVVTNSLISN